MAVVNERGDGITVNPVIEGHPVINGQIEMERKIDGQPVYYGIYGILAILQNQNFNVLFHDNFPFMFSYRLSTS